jgi:ribonucleotide reductase alpha subunit
MDQQITELRGGRLGYVTFKRTYARRLDDTNQDSPTESWLQMNQRLINALPTLGLNLTEDEQKELLYLFLNQKCSLAGRFLFQLGTATTKKMGIVSCLNCAFCVVDKPIQPFTWAMTALMLGCGVGVNIQREYVRNLPAPRHLVVTREDTRDADFIVSDKREGWVALLERLLRGHFEDGVDFTYSTILLRSRGATIKGFGGTASGPDILCEGIHKINGVLNARTGQPMRPVDCLDIINIISSIVIAGNVRRSAAIAIGDYEDEEYMNAKRWDLGNIPPWRAYSNNSVVCNDINRLPESFWDTYSGNGEPIGLLNMDLARKCGRTGETQYADPLVRGTNPCITGDTVIATTEGPKTVLELVRKQFCAISYAREPFKSTCDGFWCTGLQKVCELRLVNGDSVRATPEHKFLTREQTGGHESIWVQLGNIVPGNLVMTGNLTAVPVEAVVLCDKEELVYDCTIPFSHHVIANNIVCHNCGEQSLEDRELCNLSELFLPHIESPEELWRCTQFLYRICKHAYTLHAPLPGTDAVIQRNMRLGIGVSGYLQAPPEKRQWLRVNYERLRAFDKEYAAAHKMPPSVKLTTVKPSGTISLLAGVTPGCHPAYAPFYIRRVRFAAESPLVQQCQTEGYHTEPEVGFDGRANHMTTIVEFPMAVPVGTVCARDMNAIKQMEVVKELQANWSDNSVSVTVYYRKEELPAIRQWLRENYNDHIKSVSFLLHNEHGFAQAPYEEISADRYNAMMARIAAAKQANRWKTQPSIGSPGADDAELQDFECAGGACPIR